jgi:hypothetical protein
MEWLFRGGARRRLGVPPSHYRGGEPLFNYLARASFEDRFAAQNFGAVRLFVEISFDAVDLVLSKQARIRMGMPQLEASATVENVLD